MEGVLGDLEPLERLSKLLSEFEGYSVLRFHWKRLLGRIKGIKVQPKDYESVQNEIYGVLEESILVWKKLKDPDERKWEGVRRDNIPDSKVEGDETNTDGKDNEPHAEIGRNEEIDPVSDQDRMIVEIEYTELKLHRILYTRPEEFFSVGKFQRKVISEFPNPEAKMPIYGSRNNFHAVLFWARHFGVRDIVDTDTLSLSLHLELLTQTSSDSFSAGEGTFEAIADNNNPVAVDEWQRKKNPVSVHPSILKRMVESLHPKGFRVKNAGVRLPYRAEFGVGKIHISLAQWVALTKLFNPNPSIEESPIYVKGIFSRGVISANIVIRTPHGIQNTKGESSSTVLDLRDTVDLKQESVRQKLVASLSTVHRKFQESTTDLKKDKTFSITDLIRQQEMLKVDGIEWQKPLNGLDEWQKPSYRPSSRANSLPDEMSSSVTQFHISPRSQQLLRINTNGRHSRPTSSGGATESRHHFFKRVPSSKVESGDETLLDSLENTILGLFSRYHRVANECEAAENELSGCHDNAERLDLHLKALRKRRDATDKRVTEAFGRFSQSQEELRIAEGRVETSRAAVLAAAERIQETKMKRTRISNVTEKMRQELEQARRSAQRARAAAARVRIVKRQRSNLTMQLEEIKVQLKKYRGESKMAVVRSKRALPAQSSGVVSPPSHAFNQSPAASRLHSGRSPREKHSPGVNSNNSHRMQELIEMQSIQEGTVHADNDHKNVMIVVTMGGAGECKRWDLAMLPSVDSHPFRFP
eukprot:jgi/Bigna1/142601/aug1.71_g17309